MDEINKLLIPNHRKLSSEEINSLLVKYKIKSVENLPKIHKKDPAIKSLDLKPGEVVEITRKSFVGTEKYYRVCLDE